MLLEDKTKQLSGKTFEQCTWEDRIWVKCDYCGLEIEKRKGKYLESIKKCVTKKDCCGNYKCRKLKQNDSNLIKYGTESHFIAESVREKTKQTNLERYGVDNVFKNKEIRDKFAQTNIERYGKPSYSQTNEFLDKCKNTSLEHYGVDHPFKSKEIQEKQKLTNQKKYGVDNVFQIDEVKQKITNYNIEHYGVKHFVESKEFKEKLKETSIQKYGTEIPINSEEIRNKITESCIKRFGTKTPLENKDFREFCVQTMFEKYGVKTPFAIPDIRNKIKQIIFEKYGVYNPTQSKEIFDKIIETCIKNYGMFPVLNKFGKTQKDIQEWLVSIGFKFESDWSILGNREIDLFNSNLKLGIEYCGLYWHSERSKNNRYHYDKYKRCLDKEIRLITIFEDEWLSRSYQIKGFIKSILGVFERKIFARKCNVKEIEKSLANHFINNHHIIGPNYLGKIFFGIYQNNELLGVMSLGKHHRQGHENIVLDRLCFAEGIQIIGGSNKLFKRCVSWAKDNGYNKIISWSDNRWSQGNVYNKLGFVLETNLPPDYSYAEFNKRERLSKQSCRKNNINCPKNKTEKEHMSDLGYTRIWDCGKKRWAFNLS